MTDPEDDVIDAGDVPVITDVKIGERPYCLVVRFDDGRVFLADMAGIVHKRPALAALRDPAAFARFEIVFHGAGVAWEAGPDFSADALRHLAEVQQDMTGADFADWMERMGVSNNEAADALGTALRTIKAYKVKAGPLPSMVTIACRAMERDRLMLLARVKPRKPGRPAKRQVLS